MRAGNDRTVDVLTWPASGPGQRRIDIALRLRAVGRIARRKPLGAFGGIAIAPYHYDEQNLRMRLQPASADHPMGTDANGRDVFSRVVHGARTSVAVGFSAVAVSMVLATTIGLVSGYYGGLADKVIQRFVDLWIAFPSIILLLVVVGAFGSTGGALFRSTVLIAVLGVVLAAGSSRVIRSAVIAVRANQYVEAARAVGAGNPRLLLVHILPNVAPVIIVLATVQLGGAVLAESSLSYLGYGIPPPIPSWGQMLSRDGLTFMRINPWLAIWPGAAIGLTVLGFNLLGDALRDVLDPRLRGG
jgi:peptide/nickel transport system permease protein